MFQRAGDLTKKPPDKQNPRLPMKTLKIYSDGKVTSLEK